jgi:hypothetical protein
MTSSLRRLQVGFHGIPPRRLTIAIVKRTFSLTPNEGTSSRNWNVLSGIRTTQLMGYSNMLLVAAPGHEDISTGAIWNLANRGRVPVAMVLTLMGVPLGYILVLSTILTNITLPALKLVLYFISLAPALCSEHLVAIRPSAHEVCCLDWIRLGDFARAKMCLKSSVTITGVLATPLPISAAIDEASGNITTVSLRPPFSYTFPGTQRR